MYGNESPLLTAVGVYAAALFVALVFAWPVGIAVRAIVALFMFGWGLIPW